MRARTVAGNWKMNLNLEDFSVMDSPNLHLDASGRMDLVRAGNSLSLTGDLIAEEGNTIDVTTGL